MKKLVVATLVVVLFGGVALAQTDSEHCMESARNNTCYEEQEQINNGGGSFGPQEEADVICGFYNECMSNM